MKKLCSPIQLCAGIVCNQLAIIIMSNWICGPFLFSKKGETEINEVCYRLQSDFCVWCKQRCKQECINFKFCEKEPQAERINNWIKIWSFACICFLQCLHGLQIVCKFYRQHICSCIILQNHGGSCQYFFSQCTLILNS